MNTVRIDRQPPLRHVWLDTGARNVLSLAAIEELSGAIAWDADAPVVVLHGRSDGFCAGLDNAALAASDQDREAILAAMGSLLLQVLAGPTRVVLVCEGHAVAAGAMLLLVADVRIGTPGKYKIGFTEPRLGMPLPELPVLLARERLDRRRLHALTVLGRIVDPASAVEAGFLDRIVEPGELAAVTQESAREVSALSESAYQGTKAALWGPAIERIESLVASQNARRDAAPAD